MKDIVSTDAAVNRLQTGVWDYCTHCHANGELNSSMYWGLKNGIRYYGDIGYGLAGASLKMGDTYDLFRRLSEDDHNNFR
jgi:hypothetical protein